MAFSILTRALQALVLAHFALNGFLTALNFARAHALSPVAEGQGADWIANWGEWASQVYKTIQPWIGDPDWQTAGLWLIWFGLLGVFAGERNRDQPDWKPGNAILMLLVPVAGFVVLAIAIRQYFLAFLYPDDWRTRRSALLDVFFALFAGAWILWGLIWIYVTPFPDMDNPALYFSLVAVTHVLLAAADGVWIVLGVQVLRAASRGAIP